MKPFRIIGLHHVTATAGEAQPDLDFCLETLSLRLVKKTVNFDNPNVYHFYYGDARGTPGTLWTTFPYHGHGVPRGRHGAGQVAATAFSVPAGSLEDWTRRVAAAGSDARVLAPRFGERIAQVRDPSGLVIELVESREDSREPWTGGLVDDRSAIRGLHHVTLLVRDPEPTLDFMRTILGFAVIDEETGRIRAAVGDGTPGRLVDVTFDSAADSGANGIGTVHHVAMVLGSGQEQLALRDALIELGVRVTPVMDRQYFQSIYFREPGGVLFEAATMRPGFAVDEPLSDLGRALKLPPWEEPHRESITRALPAVHYR